MDFSKFKLIIFDLDETLWQGVLSEGTAQMPPENIKLIVDMVDSGVMCSICSKNEYSCVDVRLRELGIRDYFVFPSINWTAKGVRVRQIVEEMNLRLVNVLFVDDNPTNRSEVAQCCPGITVADEKILLELVAHFSQCRKRDTDHTRLKQYQVLEKKQNFKAASGSNEEFLSQCNIHVEIGRDCISQLPRIAELVLRSNQLNFTKVRSSEEELKELFGNPEVECGYVTVRDNFGDYGIVGFYAKKQDTLLHFVFSCRVLNMGVEQYVYSLLGKPALNIVGEISSDLNSPEPFWINREISGFSMEKQDVSGRKILIKGPCDMHLLFSFIDGQGDILTEFAYVNDRGIRIEQGNHTTQILQAATLSEEDKDRLAALPFGDRMAYETALFDEDLQFALLSLFTDPNLGIYREKSTGIPVIFGEYTCDLTDEAQWSAILKKEVYTANHTFTEAELRAMKDNFTFCGRITPEEIVDNLEEIFRRMNSHARLLLSLGVEVAYEKNTQPAYADRHLYNRELNRRVRAWAADKPRVILLDVNPFLTSQDAFTNNINHFHKTVYYKLSQELVRIISENGGGEYGMKSWSRYFSEKVLRKLQRLFLRGQRKKK